MPILVVAQLVRMIALTLRLLERETYDKAAKTLADAVHFADSTTESQDMVDRVVARASEMAEGKQRLVVVAHSQGGAITWLAIQEPGWPQIPTQVVTLGSGHYRLLTLRSMRARWTRRVALAIWSNTALLGSSFLGLVLAFGVADIVGRGVSRDDVLGGPALIFFALIAGLVVTLVLGPPLLYVQRRVSRDISDTIRTRCSYWLDVWATHDIVPDGPVNTERHASLRVVNRRSLITDHVTYHENAAGVVAAIVHCIDPSRLKADHAHIQEMREARRHQYRRRRQNRSHRRILRCASTMEHEFAGRALPVERREPLTRRAFRLLQARRVHSLFRRNLG